MQETPVRGGQEAAGCASQSQHAEVMSTIPKACGRPLHGALLGVRWLLKLTATVWGFQRLRRIPFVYWRPEARKHFPKGTRLTLTVS